MSSIIKSRYIKQGSVVNLHDSMWFTYLDTTETFELEENEEPEIEIIEESPIDYNVLYEEALKAKEVILAQAKEQAKQIREEAKEQAQIMEQEVAKKSQKILEEAHYQAEHMIEVAKEQVMSLEQEARETKQQILMEAEPEIVEIIETLVGHIIHEEIAKNNRWIPYIVKKMIVKEKILGGLTVYVAPEVLAHMTEQEYEELETIKNEVTLNADEALNKTTCVVETSEGSILYDISEGLDKMITDLNTLQHVRI